MKISKSEVAKFLDSLIGNYLVLAPVNEKGNIRFLPISAGTDAKLDYSNSKKPPKEILFPQSEKLFSYAVDKEGVRMEENFTNKQIVVFGIRPCDAKSFTLLDKVFDNNKYQDPYYFNKRNNTIVIGLACNDPASTCFCTSFGIGPFSTEGSDLLLVDIGDDYVIEAVTDKGKDFASKLSLTDAGDVQELIANAREAATSKVSSKVEIEGLKEKLDGMYDDDFWNTVFEKCLGCATCTYLCPTCHCFDLIQEAVDTSGNHVRNWDSCMFPLFTLHGSGHNPRPTGKERFRQRVMHKFRYFVENTSETACVGCGRCVKNCPVNLDIRQVLTAIQAKNSEAGVSN